ncbi:MAG TPA: hypothetical protein VGK33_17930 [Chloroflexota bacterium]
MTSTHRMTTTAALILTLAGVAAPAATARPADDPATPVSQAPASVYSRQDKSIVPATSPATSGAAVGRAALLRSLAQQKRQRVAALSAYREGQLAAAFDVAATAANKTNAPQAVVRIHAPQIGFDWGDAAIGAAGGLALAMLGLAGGLVVSQRRGRTRHGTA